MGWRSGQSGTVVSVFVVAAGIAVTIQWAFFNFQAQTQSVDAEIPVEEDSGKVKLSAAVSQALRSDMGSKYAGRNVYTVISYVLSTDSDSIYVRRNQIGVQEAREDVKSVLRQRISNSLLADSREIDYRLTVSPQTQSEPISVGDYQPSGAGTVYQQRLQISEEKHATLNLFTADKKSGKGLYP
jgi:hypothetical protein|nr:MAG: hypothetical protein J07AB56_02870 [Candidatus Nanosalinarum sp. J07AB56]